MARKPSTRKPSVAQRTLDAAEAQLAIMRANREDYLKSDTAYNESLEKLDKHHAEAMEEAKKQTKTLDWIRTTTFITALGIFFGLGLIYSSLN